MSANGSRSLLALSLLAAAVLLGTVIAYLPGMKAGFYFDDEPNIVDAPALHWQEVSFDNIESLTSSSFLKRRVLANATFALNHLAGGLDPWGYHVVNLLLHLLVGGVLVWTCYLLALEGAVRSPRRPTVLLSALVAAGLFLVHPLNIQAVTYVVQRMSSMAALFCLASFGCYLSARRAPTARRRGVLFLAAFLCWLAALGSKENALVLPLVVVAYELTFHLHSWRNAGKRLKADPRRLRISVAVAATITVGGLLLLWSYLGGWPALHLTEPWPQRDFSAFERVLTQSRVQLLYISRLFWPAPSQLNLDHHITVSRSLVEPGTTLPAVLFWFLFGAGVVVLARKRPRYGFPVVAYLLLHAIEAGPVNLELAFEHRMYLPMATLAWLVATALVDLTEAQRRVAVIVVLLLAVPLAVATHRRNLTWADWFEFHYDVARKSPEKYRPQYNLGTHLGMHGRYFEAIPVLKKAIALDPGSSEAHNQLGATYLRINLLDQALLEYRQAVELGPENAQAHYNLASFLDARGRPQEAAKLYRRFVEIAPPDLDPYKEQVLQRLRALALMNEGHGTAVGSKDSMNDP